MLENIKDLYYMILLGGILLTCIGTVVGIKIKHTSKLKDHDEKIKKLDEFKQSTEICKMFQREMKDDIRSITGTLKVIQVASVETQTSIARIEGRLNGKR